MSSPGSIDFERYTRPAPQRAEKAALFGMEQAGNRNNVISLHIQQQLHALMAQAPYWYLNKGTRSQMRQMQAAAFEGCYPLQEDRMGIVTAVNARRSEHTAAVLGVLQNIELFIEEQEAHWKNTGYTGDILRMHQEIDATDQLAKKLGGRVLMFGSARKDQNSPEYPAAQWLTHQITEHFVQEDGQGEQVISGAGPGIMEAANRGAMEGSWEVLMKMYEEFQDTQNASLKEKIIHRMLKQRMQMTSIGVRVQLPFEAGWNDHLQANLTIKTFVPRKMSLISTAVGRGISHTKDTRFDWHNRHPAVFVLTGGFGTMDELWDIACLEQCRKMPNMPIFIVGKAMRKAVEASLEVMEAEGTIGPKDRNFFHFCEDEVDALQQYANHYGLEQSEELRKEIRLHKPLIDAKEGSAVAPAKAENGSDARTRMDPALINFDRIIDQELQAARQRKSSHATTKR